MNGHNTDILMGCKWFCSLPATSNKALLKLLRNTSICIFMLLSELNYILKCY